MYDADIKQSGAKISYHLLEKNRICVSNMGESNFHVFYILLFGSTSNLLENICLDPSSFYKVRKLLFLLFTIYDFNRLVF